MLSESQVEFYRINGYLGVEDVFSADEIDELRRVTDEFVERSRSVTQHSDVFDLEPGHTPEQPRLRRLKSPALHHPVYDRALRHPRVLDLVAQLIGPNIRQNGHKLNLKSAAFGSPVEWHQDWAFYPHTNDDLLAVGICIDGMSLENGCLLVIPGSHCGPLYDHHQNGVFIGAITDPNFAPANPVAIELRAGGISIHHARTLHASAPNRSAQPRRLLLHQYCAADAFPLSGVSDLDRFNADLMRGDATLEPRLATVPVRIPLPNPPRTGSIYELQTQFEKPLFERGS